MLNHLQAAWKAFRNPALVGTGQKTIYGGSTYNLYSLLNAGGGLIDRQLARNIFGANLAYQTVPEVKAALDVIAEHIAIVPLEEKDAKGNTVARSDENPERSLAITAMLDSQQYYGIALRSLVAYSLKMPGMAFIEMLRNEGGLFTKGLRWLNPAQVEVWCPRGKIETYYYNEPYGERREIPVRDMVMLRDFNPADDVYGYGTTLNIMSKANAVLDYDRMKISYFRNGAQPGILVQFKENVSEEAARQAMELYKQTLRGVDNFFKTHAFSVPADVTSMEPIDISRPMQVAIEDGKAILRGYRVAPEMIGDTTNNPYQFSPEKRYGFMLGVIQPILDKLLWGLNQQFMPRVARPGHKLFADFSAFDVVTDTEKAAQQMFHDDFKNGRITWNEYRAGNNYAQLDGGDFFMLPTVGYVAVPATNIAQAPQLVSQAQQPALPATSQDLERAVERLSVQQKMMAYPKGEWSESDHPRDEQGRFGSGGGSSGDSDSGEVSKKPPDWASGGKRSARRDSDGYMDYGHMHRNDINNAAGQMKAKEMSNEQTRNLEPHHQEAAQTYTGEDYRNINKRIEKGLRNGEVPAGYEDTVANLDEALTQNSLSENTVLYRGMTMNDDLRSQLKPGATFTDNAYVSTSLDQQVPSMFAGKESAVMRIRAPEGQNGLAASALSEYPEESEFLLPRGTRFNITAVAFDEDSGKTFIDAEIARD